MISTIFNITSAGDGVRVNISDHIQLHRMHMQGQVDPALKNLTSMPFPAQDSSFLCRTFLRLPSKSTTLSQGKCFQPSLPWENVMTRGSRVKVELGTEVKTCRLYPPGFVEVPVCLEPDVSHTTGSYLRQGRGIDTVKKQSNRR